MSDERTKTEPEDFVGTLRMRWDVPEPAEAFLRRAADHIEFLQKENEAQAELLGIRQTERESLQAEVEKLRAGLRHTARSLVRDALNLNATKDSIVELVGGVDD